jgi:Uma2 family endonuclease
MASATRPRPVSAKRKEPEQRLPPLENGDHLDQKTFHARYEAMPPETRAELIGGIVYMSSPLKRPHGRYHSKIMTWLGTYEAATPGTESLDNTTAILGSESEPQPDAFLVILPECGGQTRENASEYLEGPPELVVEVASSTESIDLYSKRRDYEKAGVKEYLVVALRQKRVFWFVRRRGRFKELALDPDDLLRSLTFPGLWLDPQALLHRDLRRMLEVLHRGINTPEHAAFVDGLAHFPRN